MKLKKLILITLVLLILFISLAFQKQKAEWKGTIEKENGVKVIKNPREPLYGEIEFQLEEDLRIGNEENENYMFFMLPSISVDSEENILVLDRGNCR